MAKNDRIVVCCPICKHSHETEAVRTGTGLCKKSWRTEACLRLTARIAGFR